MSEDASTWVQKFLAHVPAVGDPLLAHQRLLGGQDRIAALQAENNLLAAARDEVATTEWVRVRSHIAEQDATIVALRAEIAVLKAGAATPPPPPDPKALPANALKWSK